ncbi:class I SAM-dependent methyltransferase [Nodosilinea sp. LEGE 07088]|uniref:class I SAM-dependent methyltransferase n=1 Tax=Nodosilinea sp. LEGE 07088 TaxID=2777968 RepID=UPI00187DDD63|nr:class I SAM-dependent methyltransferase [Nodosilinea sp. LEGE 07088]MBE9138621.1 class I SAM-dependent methyltransferase [Nodosilinea sp. LEGE 07088]
MKALLELKRLALLAPEAVLCGPSYAQFFFWSRNTRPLDAETTWQQFTQPQNPYYEWALRHYPPAPIRRLWATIYPKLRDRVKGISTHYDISNDFYKLFLDQDYAFYTCGDFLDPDDSLEMAQKHKADFILNLIAPRPGDRILDLGCGWGAMLKRIYQYTGDRENLWGYTLSVEQKRFIDETYGFNVEIKDVVTADYAPASWDKIYSIGCMEHVPKDQLLPLAQKLAAAIKPTGHLVHHFFCQMTPSPPAKMLAGGADVFPGIELATWQQHVDTFEKAGLRVAHHSIHDYRPTIKAWYDRLAAHQTEAIQLVGVRTYNRYLCYLAEAWRLFDDRDLLLMRFVLTRQDAPTPWLSALYRAESRESPVEAPAAVLQAV